MMTPEWKPRIERWRDAMPKLFYRPVEEIAFEGFATKEQLRPEEALKRKFSKMPEGASWGAKWEYGWFRARIKIPKSLAGRRVVMKANVGAEAAAFVNGSEAGGTSVHGWGGVNDVGGREITLAHKAKGGETFEILVEGYAGHGVRNCSGGPCPHGELTVPEPPAAQVKVGKSSFGVWDEDMYQLWLDAETLYQLYDAMNDKDSLRAAEIAEALQEMTLAVDLELPCEEMLKTVREGRRILKRLLDKRNGSTAPKMSCFGHSHIDTAWLWPLQETERKCCRTFSSQLALMDEYPEFRFLQSQPHLFTMVMRRYPELYKRLKQAAKRGQLMPEGGMWVEADTNITGGESLIRQFLHGKRFFKEEFGVDSKMLWLPDVFGYTGSLPQIMAGCGVTCFSTQKIFWTYNGGDIFPYNLFWWEGIDGTQTLSYIHNDYNSETFPRAIMRRWNERVQKDAFHNGRLTPFGYGDGGGGPTRSHLEFLRREKDLEGLPKCEIEHPLEFFKRQDTSKIPTWAGELYFQAHRGTFTTQAKTKKGNRKSEFALREAEIWGCAATAFAGFKFPLEKADALWKLVLLNQFHDIIPGSSIQRVYEEAEADYAKVIKESEEIANGAKAKILKRAPGSVTVFNSLSWERDALVEIPSGFDGLVDAKGVRHPAQKSEGKNYALVKGVPSCGWTSLRKAESVKADASKAVKADAKSMENEFLKLAFNGDGEIVSVVDKESGQEFAAGPCNSLRLFKDVPSSYDAWDIDSMYKAQPVELKGKTELKLVAKGPLFATLRATRTIGCSELSQDITLRSGSRRVDFNTVIDWKESHKLLKAAFPLAVRAEDALHEIQFGHIRRPTHANKPYDANRFEVCNQKWTALAEEGRGAAVLNDCKYGVNVEGSCVSLTLLRSPLAPDMRADKGRQEFAYSLLVWTGAFKDSGTIRESYDLNVPATASAGDAGTCSLLKADAANVIVETVKPAEDGSGDIVVRLYEAMRTATVCSLELGLPVKKALETDMLEDPKGEFKLKGSSIKLEFRPFEIKTIRLKL